LRDFGASSARTRLPQTTFSVGGPDDADERAAELTAQRVMRGEPVAPLRDAPLTLQRLPVVAPNRRDAPAVVQQVLATPGVALDTDARTFFEPRFARDFSNVRVHADDAADRSASALDAQAYTIGSHIVFASARYVPKSDSGRRLLAHELAHVVQQSRAEGGARIQRKGGRGPGSCGLLSAAAATVLGGFAHVQIQTRLLGRGITPELEIPRASKTGGISRRCQPLTTPPGFADLARVARPIISVGEIKPYYVAQLAGRLEARHYRRRAEQSKQRLTRTGGCGRRSGPGPDDMGFTLNPLVGPISLASTFALLSGAISGTEDFGPFSQDATRNLMAKEVGGGAIGYWCVLNAAGKKQKEDEKKAKEKGKAGAGNVGIGVSIGGSNVGGANAGVGVSIDSNSAAVGTAGAGIAIASDSAAAGAAGVGVSKDSMSAAAGAAGVGVSEDSQSVAAGAAGAGSTSGSTSAGAGVAGAGKSEDNVTAGAGVAGKGEMKGSIAAGAGSSGSGKVEGATGAGVGSPKKPIDPNDVSGPGADQVPPGHGDDEGGTGGHISETAGGDAASAGASGNTGAAGTGSGQQAGSRSGQAQGSAAGQQQETGSGSGTGKQGVSGTGARSGRGSGSSSNPLGVYTVIPLGTSDADREKLAAEAAKVSLLLRDAQAGQIELLRYLSATSLDKRYIVPASDWVQKVLNVTRGLTPDQIEYLKQLDWKPGHVSEEELRKRVQQALANRDKKPTSDDTSPTETEAPNTEGASGGGSGRGKGSGTGTGGQKTGAGSNDTGTQPTSTGGVVDRASAPPAGSDRSTGGIFAFQILAGMSPSSQLSPGQAVSCRLRINDPKIGTFDLDGVSVTFVSRTDTAVTIRGTRFIETKFNIYFTNDFWSEKNKFYGKGGKESLTEFDFGRRKTK